MFSVDKAKFLRLPILKTSERLLTDCFNGSLILRPKGLRSIFYDSISCQGQSHRSFFVINFFFNFFVLLLSCLNRVPTCVWKYKANAFDELINPPGIYLLRVNNRNTRTIHFLQSKTLNAFIQLHWLSVKSSYWIPVATISGKKIFTAKTFGLNCFPPKKFRVITMINLNSITLDHL